MIVKGNNIGSSHEINVPGSVLPGRQLLQFPQQAATDTAALVHWIYDQINYEPIQSAVADQAPHANYLVIFDGADGELSSVQSAVAVLGARNFPANSRTQGYVL